MKGRRAWTEPKRSRLGCLESLDPSLPLQVRHWQRGIDPVSPPLLAWATIMQQIVFLSLGLFVRAFVFVFVEGDSKHLLPPPPPPPPPPLTHTHTHTHTHAHTPVFDGDKTKKTRVRKSVDASPNAHCGSSSLCLPFFCKGEFASFIVN